MGREKNGKKLPIQYGKASLNSDDSLKLKSEFDAVRKSAKKFVGSFFLLLVEDGTVSDLKYGIICGRKFSNKAVVRNRARRLVKESFRLIKNRIDYGHLIFIPRQRIKHQRLQEVQMEMIELLKRAKIWKEPKKK